MNPPRGGFENVLGSKMYCRSRTLAQEQQFAVFRQHPFLVIDKELELVDMIPDIVKVRFLHLAVVFDRLRTGVRHIVGYFPRVDHFPDHFAHPGNMQGDLFEDLLLAGVGGGGKSHVLQSPDVVDEGILVLDRRRKDVAGGQFAHDAGFDLYALHIFFQLDLMAGFQFDVGIDAVGLEKMFGLFGNHGIEGQRSRTDIGQPAPFGFMVPFIAVAVAFEQYFLAFHDVFADHVHDRDFLLIAFLDQGIDVLLEAFQGFGEDSVEDDHRVRAIGAGTYRPELELITGEREGRSPVAVGVVQQELGDTTVEVEFQDGLILLVEFFANAFLDVRQYFSQVFADKDRNDRRRSFVRTQAEIVTRRGNGSAQDVGVVMDSLDGIDKERQEHQVGLRRLAGSQEVDARIGSHAPVVVLAASVDTGEGLLVQQHPELVTPGHAIHDIHQEDIVVDRDAYFLEDRGALELCGGYFIVPRAQGNAQFVSFLLVIPHERVDALGDAAEIVVFELLAFCRRMTEDGAAAHDEVGAGIEQALVDDKIFLFPAQRGGHLGDVLIEIMTDLDGSFVERGQRFQKGRLIVEGFARVADEDGRNAK